MLIIPFPLAAMTARSDPGSMGQIRGVDKITWQSCALRNVSIKNWYTGGGSLSFRGAVSSAKCDTYRYTCKFAAVAIRHSFRSAFQSSYHVEY